MGVLFGKGYPLLGEMGLSWANRPVEEVISETMNTRNQERIAAGLPVRSNDEALSINRDPETGALVQTTSMVVVGQTTPGQQQVDLSNLTLPTDQHLLYDEVTGIVYSTTNWGDVSANEGAYIAGSGERFRGYVEDAYGGRGQGRDRSPAGTFTHLVGSNSISSEEQDAGNPMLAIFGDAPPPPPDVNATVAEINEWQKKRAKWLDEKTGQAIGRQAAQHLYNPETGKFGEGGQDYGQFASMSTADWVALGRPSRVGDVTFSEETIESLSTYSDEQLAAAPWTLTGQDTKKPKHGLNKVGASFGWSSMGDQIADVAGFIPVVGSFVSRAIDTYSATGNWSSTVSSLSDPQTLWAAGVGLITSGVGSGISNAFLRGATKAVATSAITSMPEAYASGSWRNYATNIGMSAVVGGVTSGVSDWAGTDASNVADLRWEESTAWQAGWGGNAFNFGLNVGANYLSNRLQGASSHDAFAAGMTSGISALGAQSRAVGNETAGHVAGSTPTAQEWYLGYDSPAQAWYDGSPTRPSPPEHQRTFLAGMDSGNAGPLVMSWFSGGLPPPPAAPAGIGAPQSRQTTDASWWNNFWSSRKTPTESAVKTPPQVSMGIGGGA